MLGRNFLCSIGDVIAGAILGIVVQTLNCIFVMKLFNPEADSHSYVAVVNEGNVESASASVSSPPSSSTMVPKNRVGNDDDL